MQKKSSVQTSSNWFALSPNLSCDVSPHLCAKPLNCFWAGSVTLYMCFLGSPEISTRQLPCFSLLPALLPECFSINRSPRLGFLKLPQPRLFWEVGEHDLTLLLYKSLSGIQRGYYIASPMSYKILHENRSFHFYSEPSPSLPPTLRETRSGTLPSVSLVPTLQILKVSYRATLVCWTLPRVSLNPLCQQSS